MARNVCTVLILSIVVLFSSSIAHADPGTVDFLNFNYLGNLQQVGNFYNGGGGSGVPNLGVTFSSNFYGLHSLYASVNAGSGNFTPGPLQTPLIFIQGSPNTTATGYINVTGGFSSGVNFFYTAAFKETATVWSGANGTGTVLATINLSPNDSFCASGGPAYCNWTDVGLKLAPGAVADSVTFSGPANGIGITDITLGSSTSAVPEPSSMYLLGTGLVGFCFHRLRRFFAA